jgi:hypothetical protein
MNKGSNGNNRRKQPVVRKISDPCKLKPEIVEFFREWTRDNGKSKKRRSIIKKALDSTPNYSGKSNSRQVWTNALDTILRPVFTMCRHPYKQKCRSNSSDRCIGLNRECKSRTVNEVLIEKVSATLFQNIQRRTKSDSNLLNLQECSPTQKKRKVYFGFGSPMKPSYKKMAEKAACCNSQPRPILLQRNYSEPPPSREYMDYSTFKAWRRGSRLSIDICSVPLNIKECKEKRLERLLKKFMAGCVVQMSPQRSVPDA